MNAIDILADLAAGGVTLTLDGDDLLVDGAADKLTAEVIEQVRSHKHALIATLSVPSACVACGCAIGWRDDGRVVVCAACGPAPQDAVLLVLVNLPSDNEWSPLAEERAARDQHEHAAADDASFIAWDDCIPWDESTPICPSCNCAAGWIDARDGWHCMKCDPPTTSRRLLCDRDRILQRQARRNGGRNP